MSVETKDNTDEVLKKLEEAKRKGLEAIGLLAEGYAKENCPVDTGRLRNSISHAKDKENAYIGTNVEYAPYVELGSRGKEPVHFLQRASSEHAEEYLAIMEDALRNA